MFIESRYLKPHLGTYVKHLLFGMVLSVFFGFILYLFTTANPLSFTMPRWWAVLLLIPVITAIVLSSGGRQVELVIADSDDLDIINQWIRDRFLPKKHTKKTLLTLAIPKSVGYIFCDFFKTLYRLKKTFF